MRRSLGPTARYIRVAATAAALSVSLSSGPAAAIDLVIVNTDPPGVGLNDTTPVAPVGGNLATTLGAQRLLVLREAARIWGLALPGTIPIKVTASFSTLPCVSFAAALGATEPTAVFANFNGAPLRDTFYPKALADTLSGRELNPSNSAIDTRFNAGIGQPGCLAGSPFYLGFDNAHGSSIDLLTVALHEFAHGLGFESGADENGTFAGGPWISTTASSSTAKADGRGTSSRRTQTAKRPRRTRGSSHGAEPRRTGLLLGCSPASPVCSSPRTAARVPPSEIVSGYIGLRLTDPGDSGRLVAVTPPDGCAPRNEDVGGRIVTPRSGSLRNRALREERAGRWRCGHRRRVDRSGTARVDLRDGSARVHSRRPDLPGRRNEAEEPAPGTRHPGPRHSGTKRYGRCRKTPPFCAGSICRRVVRVALRPRGVSPPPLCSRASRPRSRSHWT